MENIGKTWLKITVCLLIMFDKGNTSTYLKLQKEMDSRNHYNLVKTPSSELS